MTPTPQHHTGSYYAASVNEVTDFAALHGDVRSDVCVIGAGFTGVSTALHLAERGYKVHVVEANRIGWGASGRNGGQIISGISGEQRLAKAYRSGGEKALWEMGWAGHDIIRQRVEKYGIQCDLKFGYLDVAIKPRHIRAIHAELEQMERYNFPYETRFLDAAETRETIGTSEYIGSLLNMGNGHLHPLNFCIGGAKAAQSLGAVFYEQSPVSHIEYGDTPSVVTATGKITADAVVLAGNAYHFVDKRLRGHLFPVNSFIIATEPLPAEVVAEINPRDLAVCDPNFVLEYFRLSADKRLLFGGRVRYFGSDPEYIKSRLRPKMLRVYPQLERFKIDYAWGGTIGVTVNRVPQMGRLAPNVFYSQGYSGHGVNVTQLAGQIMADAVAGTMERFDLFAGIKPTLIPGAHTFSKQMVSLGMLYYRLRDKL
jgi:glycine/D-amino acid oxidase-like deaminating enzyme